MRALLVNPWIYDFKAFDFWNKPLGILIVADILKKVCFELEFIDCMDRSSPYYKTATKTDFYGRGKYCFEVMDKPPVYKNVPRRYKRYGIPTDVFIEQLKKIKRPDIIFITSSMTYWYHGVVEAIKILKQEFVNIPVVVGGLFATLCNEYALKNSLADHVIPGNAESELIKFLKEKGFLIKNIDTENILPDFSLYPALNYGVVITSRGCPFNCTYCATKILHPEFICHDIKLILKQIEYFAQKTNNIAVFDDALLCNPGFPFLLEKIIAKNYKIDLHSANGLHCRFIDKNIASLMYKANFRTMYLSLETTNPEVQKNTGNKVNTQEFLKAVDTLTRVGFSSNQIHVYLLYGIPGQSYEEIIDGINLCHRLGVNPHLCEYSPIPYTEEYKKTGFDSTTDPLYHNNHFYTWYYHKAKPEIYRKIKNLLSCKRLQTVEA